MRPFKVSIAMLLFVFALFALAVLRDIHHKPRGDNSSPFLSNERFTFLTMALQKLPRQWSVAIGAQISEIVTSWSTSNEIELLNQQKLHELKLQLDDIDALQKQARTIHTIPNDFMSLLQTYNKVNNAGTALTRSMLDVNGTDVQLRRLDAEIDAVDAMIKQYERKQRRDLEALNVNINAIDTKNSSIMLLERQLHDKHSQLAMLRKEWQQANLEAIREHSALEKLQSIHRQMEHDVASLLKNHTSSRSCPDIENARKSVQHHAEAVIIEDKNLKTQLENLDIVIVKHNSTAERLHRLRQHLHRAQQALLDIHAVINNETRIDQSVSMFDVLNTRLSMLRSQLNKLHEDEELALDLPQLNDLQQNLHEYYHFEIGAVNERIQTLQNLQEKNGDRVALASIEDRTKQAETLLQALIVEDESRFFELGQSKHDFENQVAVIQKRIQTAEQQRLQAQKSFETAERCLDSQRQARIAAEKTALDISENMKKTQADLDAAFSIDRVSAERREKVLQSLNNTEHDLHVTKQLLENERLALKQLLEKTRSTYRELLADQALTKPIANQYRELYELREALSVQMTRLVQTADIHATVLRTYFRS